MFMNTAMMAFFDLENFSRIWADEKETFCRTETAAALMEKRVSDFCN